MLEACSRFFGDSTMIKHWLRVLDQNVFAECGRGSAYSSRAFSRLTPLALFAMLVCGPGTDAQISASIEGLVIDSSRSPVASSRVNARSIETGVTRTTTTDDAGRYLLPSLPVGEYELTVSKPGFRQAIRSGIQLAVGQEARVDLTLQISAATAEVRVIGDAPVVSTTTQDISGLVGEQQIKDLPLNGRSYDLLLPLNPGVVNFTSLKTGGTGISNSTTGNNFAISGNRPQQNLFLLNGVEYTGAAENNMQPGGTSGMLLGVEAVREFNVQRDSYGAEFGKRPGGQVVMVTQSGTNQWHGSVFEFLRNNAFDASNFFDRGGPPPFQRNQFGVAGGGPIQADKTFLFANYEGFRQHLHQTSAAFVPDLAARAAAVPSVQPLLNLWPTPSPSDPDFPGTCTPPTLLPANDCGIAQVFSSPLQTIREDFGTMRVDHTFSSRDSLSGIYTIDDGDDFTATPLDPFSADVVTLRSQVATIEETHVFSPSLINTARFGYSRAGYFFTGEPTPGTPAVSVPGFLLGRPVGAVVVGGSTASNPTAQVGLAGSNNGSNLTIARNLYTIEDRVTLIKHRHQFDFGVWLQPFQSNETLALSQFGQATFTSVQTFLQGTISSFLFDPSPTELNWRSLFGAWYAQDTIRLSPRLTLSLGFRGESSSGWNEAHGRAANYFFTNGIINGTPNVGNSIFQNNNATFLPQPRVGLAWSPLGPKTVIRAGFGIYNDLQDALGYRLDQNAPYNPVYTIAAGSIANLNFPIKPGNPPPSNALLVPGGVQPDMYTPTVETWSLRISQQLSPSTSVTVGYVGSHGYHELVGVDANAPAPVICPDSPCPATFPNTAVWGALASTPVPAGTFYTPSAAKPNPSIANTWTWFSEGTSSYHALQLDVNHRFNRGLGIRGVYTWSKSLDDGDSLNATAAANAPGLISNPYHIKSDWGLATYDVRNLGVITATYELPFAKDKLYGGWMLNGIVTAQSGFPFTPQLGYNPSNNGDTRNPVRAFVNPAFTGPVVLGNPNQWFDPNAFIAPPNSSGFYGNLGRNTFIGPGLATWDMSLLKSTRFHESHSVQLRFEVFNLLNRTNFNTPNLITHVLLPGSTTPTQSPAAGLITSTSTSSRQIQFGLKWLW